MNDAHSTQDRPREGAVICWMDYPLDDLRTTQERMKEGPLRPLTPPPDPRALPTPWPR